MDCPAFAQVDASHGLHSGTHQLLVPWETVETLAHQCQHLNRWPLNGSDSCLGNNTSAQSPNT